jgi:hypothetical protein
MNAIDLLKAQHRDVAQHFALLGRTNDTDGRQALFDWIADALAIHSTIEERHFHPQVHMRRTEKILLESLEEHLGVKRVIADLLKIDASDPTFMAKMAVLEQQVERHVREEESELFPAVSKIFDEAQLEAIGQEMQGTVTMLEGTAARRRVPAEAVAPATL